MSLQHHKHGNFVEYNILPGVIFIPAYNIHPYYECIHVQLNTYVFIF